MPLTTFLQEPVQSLLLEAGGCLREIQILTEKIGHFGKVVGECTVTLLQEEVIKLVHM